MLARFLGRLLDLWGGAGLQIGERNSWEVKLAVEQVDEAIEKGSPRQDLTDH